MATVDETIDRLITSIPKASIDDTLSLLRPSMAVIPAVSMPADPSTPESNKQAIEEQLISRALQMFVLMHHEQNIKDASAKLGGESRRLRDALSRYTMPDIPPPVLIRFVDMLEEANQYFDFKLLAKQTHHFKDVSSPDDISTTLFEDKQLLSGFPRIGEPQVTQAAQAIFWELDNEQHGNEYARPKRDCATLNLIYKLAFLTREMGYDMNEDPIVELGKIMKYEPYVYDKYFLDQQLPVEYTERSTQEALSKYSQLVSAMRANYEASGEKHELTAIATSAGNKEASNEKHELTSMATSARNKEPFHEKHGITSNVTSVKNKEAFNEKLTGAVTETKSKRSFEMTDAIKMYPKKSKTDQASKDGLARLPP